MKCLNNEDWGHPKDHRLGWGSWNARTRERFRVHLQWILCQRFTGPIISPINLATCFDASVFIGRQPQVESSVVQIHFPQEYPMFPAIPTVCSCIICRRVHFIHVATSSNVKNKHSRWLWTLRYGGVRGRFFFLLFQLASRTVCRACYSIKYYWLTPWHCRERSECRELSPAAASTTPSRRSSTAASRQLSRQGE